MSLRTATPQVRQVFATGDGMNPPMKLEVLAAVHPEFFFNIATRPRMGLDSVGRF